MSKLVLSIGDSTVQDQIPPKSFRKRDHCNAPDKDRWPGNRISARKPIATGVAHPVGWLFCVAGYESLQYQGETTSRSLTKLRALRSQTFDFPDGALPVKCCVREPWQCGSQHCRLRKLKMENRWTSVSWNPSRDHRR